MQIENKQNKIDLTIFISVSIKDVIGLGMNLEVGFISPNSTATCFYKTEKLKSKSDPIITSFFTIKVELESDGDRSSNSNVMSNVKVL